MKVRKRHIAALAALIMVIGSILPGNVVRADEGSSTTGGGGGSGFVITKAWLDFCNEKGISIFYSDCDDETRAEYETYLEEWKAKNPSHTEGGSGSPDPGSGSTDPGSGSTDPGSGSGTGSASSGYTTPLSTDTVKLEADNTSGLKTGDYITVTIKLNSKTDYFQVHNLQYDRTLLEPVCEYDDTVVYWDVAEKGDRENGVQQSPLELGDNVRSANITISDRNLEEREATVQAYLSININLIFYFW